ncbi:MAG TPA: GTP-binding protein [Nitrospira sp.]|nr:GTP-binding protein [Nitrospira sp.]
MATGASTAQAAILLIDARKGVLPQTKRHSRIVSMLGIRHVALAINKMDLLDWSKDVFDEIELAYRRFAQDLCFETITAIPVSALEGQNVVELSQVEMRWYEGKTLLDWLKPSPFRMVTLTDLLCCPCNGLIVPISTSAGLLDESPADPYSRVTPCV